MKAPVLEQQTLVLNKSWTAIHTTSVKNALVLVYNKAASIVDPETYQTYTFNSWCDFSRFSDKKIDELVRTEKYNIVPPEVIILRSYNHLPQMQAPLSRQNLYLRDDYQCQYCGKRPGSKELSIDHILPRSKGGITSWENCVLACTKCNCKKGSKSLENSGLKLIKKPKEPKWSPVLWVRDSKILTSWRKFLNTAYWNVDLQD